MSMDNRWYSASVRTCTLALTVCAARVCLCVSPAIKSRQSIFFSLFCCTASCILLFP